MRYLLSILMVFAIGCSNLEISKDNEILESSLEKFDREFPPSWPTKSLIEPISGEQKLAIEKMIKSLHEHLLKSGVEHKLIGQQIIILPSGQSELNQLATRLDGDSISLLFDAIYFAKNPFSAGALTQMRKNSCCPKYFLTIRLN